MAITTDAAVARIACAWLSRRALKRIKQFRALPFDEASRLLQSAETLRIFAAAANIRCGRANVHGPRANIRALVSAFLFAAFPDNLAARPMGVYDSAKKLAASFEALLRNGASETLSADFQNYLAHLDEMGVKVSTQTRKALAVLHKAKKLTPPDSEARAEVVKRMARTQLVLEKHEGQAAVAEFMATLE